MQPDESHISSSFLFPTMSGQAREQVSITYLGRTPAVGFLGH